MIFPNDGTDELAAAIHTLDKLISPSQGPNQSHHHHQRPLDATVAASVVLASLRSFARPGVSSTEVATERTRARELYDKVLKGIDLPEFTSLNPSYTVTRLFGTDVDMFVEMSKLWQGDNLDRTSKLLKEALRNSEVTDGKVDPRILNNLGVLAHLEGKFANAREFYERALTSVASASGKDTEYVSTSMLFNLARVYEDQGEDNLAKDAYEKLLSRHPEYADGRYCLFAF
jgi:RNA polymerase-associated protein CTR9